MENSKKVAVFKNIILIENIILPFINAIPALFWIFGDSNVGFYIHLYSTYILYPVIIATFIAALVCRAVKPKQYTVNFILFAVNICITALCFMGILWKLGGVLEGF